MYHFPILAQILPAKGEILVSTKEDKIFEPDISMYRFNKTQENFT